MKLSTAILGTTLLFLSSIYALGQSPTITVYPPNLDFGTRRVGTTGTLSFGIYNDGSAPLVISGVVVRGDYSETDTCRVPIQPSTHCYVYVSATPKKTGSTSGLLSISNNASGAPVYVPLSTTGVRLPRADSRIEYSSLLGGAGGDCYLWAVPNCNVYNGYYSAVGGGWTAATALTTDAAGNIYIAGYTYANDFPTTPGAYRISIGGQAGEFGYVSFDNFVTKFDPSGKLMWSTFVGSLWPRSAPSSIAVDPAGNVYVAQGPDTGQVIKLNFTGSKLLYQMAVINLENTPPVSAMTADKNGFAYITGPSWTGGGAVVTKLDTSKSGPDSVVYSVGIDNSSTGYTTPSGIAVDSAGNAYITGLTTNAAFPVTPGAFQTTYPVGSSGTGFVTKLSPDGSAFVYSTLLGGTQGVTAPSAIVVDRGGRAFLTGITSSSDFPHSVSFGTAFTTTSFITKLNPTGTALTYSALVGGASATSLALDSAGFAHVVGNAVAGFPFIHPLRNAPSTGPFFLLLNTSGNALITSSTIGDGQAAAVGVGIRSSTVLAGWTTSTTFPTTNHAFQDGLRGVQSAFVTTVRR